MKRKGGTVLVVAIVVGLVFSAGANAAAGDLDLTFSGDGKQTTDFAIGDSTAAGTVIQPDGKIVAVGTDRAHRGGDFALARYNADGSLDTSFSDDGKQRTDFNQPPFSSFDLAAGVALQDDGKIVAVGGADGDFALARYNTNGSLDTSFSGDGRQTLDFLGQGDDERLGGVAIQADGKIVAVGGSGQDMFGGGAFAVVRYNPNGSLDTSFAGDGKQVTVFGDDEFAQANAVALQADGKIVAVGENRTTGDFALARYNSDGSLDMTNSTGFGVASAAAKSVGVQGDGTIVAVGSVGPFGPGDHDFALVRYNLNGVQDSSFSGDGKLTTDFGGDDAASGVALQPDGKIVAVGHASGGGTGRDFALARYNANGSLDTGFSGDGKQRSDFGTDDAAAAVALQSDGKIVAAGQGGGTGGRDFALARYNTNGSLDPSFSGDGERRTNFGGAADAATDVALQGDGKIVAVGVAGGLGTSIGDFALARYNPDGSPDPSFSGDGKQATDFASHDDFANGVALRGDGRIVAVGFAQRGPTGQNSDFALACYNPDGSLDPSFSGDGKQATDFGFGNSDFGNGVALQGNGKIVAVGSAQGGATGEDFALARYNLDGSLDPSFSGDGKRRSDFGFHGSDSASAVALQTDGKIVTVGRAEVATGGDFGLARYNPDGSLDTSFSGDGKQTTDFGGPFAQASGMAIQPDGKIVAVGAVGGDFALARYNTNGSLDTSFSGDGKQTTDFGSNDVAAGVALQADGKIVAVGGTGGDFALARYNTNGTLDTSFSGDGKVGDASFGGASGAAIQADGNIVAAGVGLGPNQTSDFGLARYLGD